MSLSSSTAPILVDLLIVENYRSTMIDEERLYARAQQAGEAIVARAGLPITSRWPVV